MSFINQKAPTLYSQLPTLLLGRRRICLTNTFMQPMAPRVYTVSQSYKPPCHTCLLTVCQISNHGGISFFSRRSWDLGGVVREIYVRPTEEWGGWRETPWPALMSHCRGWSRVWWCRWWCQPELSGGCSWLLHLSCSDPPPTATCSFVKLSYTNSWFARSWGP